MTVKNKKIITLITLALLLTFVVCSTGLAQETEKIVKAYVKNIKIVFNGQQVSTDTQPIIVNGSTYLPLRKISVMFDKNVTWNAATQQVTITEQPNNELQTLKAQLAEKDLQIQLLQAQLEKNKTPDLDDLEKSLNKDYDDYEDIEWEINLKGNKDKITVKIEVDLGDYKREWGRLSSSRKTKFLQNIVDDIRDAYKDAKISGEIIDYDSDKDLLTFTTNSRGTVSIDESSDLDNLADQLTDDYKYYFDDMKLDVELKGDEDDITFIVNIDYNRYKTEWDNLSKSQITRLMSKIYADIEDEYSRADIIGYVYDTYKKRDMAEYDGSILDRYLP